jgi:hypothetical protein
MSIKINLDKLFNIGVDFNTTYESREDESSQNSINDLNNSFEEKIHLNIKMFDY